MLLTLVSVAGSIRYNEFETIRMSDISNKSVSGYHSRLFSQMILLVFAFSAVEMSFRHRAV